MTAVDWVLALILPVLVTVHVIMVIKNEAGVRRRRRLNCADGDSQQCQKCTQGYPLVWTISGNPSTGPQHIHLCDACNNRRLDIMRIEKELLGEGALDDRER